MMFCGYKFSEDLIYKKNPKTGSKETFMKNNSLNFNLSAVLQSLENTFKINLTTSNPNLNLTEKVINYFEINLDVYNIDKFSNLRFTNTDFKEIKIKNNTNKKPYVLSQGLNPTNQLKNHEYEYEIEFKSHITRDSIFQVKQDKKSEKNLKKFMKRNTQSQEHQDTKLSFNIKLEDIKIDWEIFCKITSAINIDIANNKTKDWEIRIVTKNGRAHFIDYLLDPEKKRFAEKNDDYFNFYKEGWAYYYQFVELKDDRHLFFTSFETEFIVQQIFFYQILLQELNMENILDCYQLYFSKSIKSQTRIFKKVPNALAEIGGVFSILLTIGNLLVCKFNKTEFDVDVINNLFYIGEKNDIKKDFEINKVINIGSNKINYNNSNMFNNFDNINFKNKDDNDYYCNSKKNVHSFNKSNCDKERKGKIFGIQKIGDENDFDYSKSNKQINDENTQITILNNISDNNISNNKLNEKSHDNNNDKSIGNLKENNFINKNIELKYKDSIDESNKNKQSVEENLLKDKINYHIQTKKAVKENRKVTKFSNSDVLKSVLCIKRFKNEVLIKQEEIISYAEKRAYGYLNALNLIRLFENFEKLKKLILNKNQLYAFSYIRNRELSELYLDKKQCLFELCKYYKEKRNNAEEQGELVSDEAIFSLLKGDVKKMFE